MFFFLMIRRPQRSTRTDTLFPYTTLFRSEHVIEERQAGGHLWRGRHVQVELPAPAGLARVAQYQCPPWCIDQGVRNSRPVPLAAELRRSQLEPPNAQVAREGHVGLAVAHHGAATPVDGAILQIGHHHADAGLALGAAVLRQAVVDQHVAERSEEHTSELQSLMRISYAVFCLKKKKIKLTT